MTTPDTPPTSAAPCPQGRTDYEECFAPFRYCPVKGCGRTENDAPDRNAALVAAGHAAIKLATAWEEFWAAVRKVEEANRGE